MTQANMFASQAEAIATQEMTVPKNEIIDVVETDEVKEKKATQQRAKFKKAIIDTRREHVNAYSTSYTTRHGQTHVIEIHECDALLYLLADQPNEPQITASAHETRSGFTRLSDES